MPNCASLYVHIPFCKSKCIYCDFFSIPTGESEKKLQTSRGYNDYVSALIAEARFRKSQFNITKISSLYIGGGTPSLLHHEDLAFFFSEIQKMFDFSSNIEITLEANPDDLTEYFLSNLEVLPINRLSLGVQSMNDASLQKSNRRSTSICNERAMRLCQQWAKNHPRQFSVDMIAGLPSETLESFTAGMEKVLHFEPKHVSLYALTVEENTPLFRLINSNKIIYDEDLTHSLWLQGKKILEQNDFVQYEVSNFSKKNFQSIHNTSYWNMGDYIGIGSGATGTIADFRYTNTVDIDLWKDTVEKAFCPAELAAMQDIENLTRKTQIFEYLMMGFRKREGVSGEIFYERFNQPIEDFIEPSFSAWQKKKLAHKRIVHGKTFYALTDKGMLFLNQYLVELMR
ncbi:MAG: radical SAM family heme chaperone HemW [Treponemataceae bacterium]